MFNTRPAAPEFESETLWLETEILPLRQPHRRTSVNKLEITKMCNDLPPLSVPI